MVITSQNVTKCVYFHTCDASAVSVHVFFIVHICLFFLKEQKYDSSNLDASCDNNYKVSLSLLAEMEKTSRY